MRGGSLPYWRFATLKDGVELFNGRRSSLRNPRVQMVLLSLNGPRASAFTMRARYHYATLTTEAVCRLGRGGGIRTRNLWIQSPLLCLGWLPFGAKPSREEERSGQRT